MVFLLIVMLLTFSSPALGAEPGDQHPEGLFVIHQIIGNPTKADEFFAITSNFGVIKSVDGGRSWQSASRGIKSFTHHALAINPTTHHLYAGAWGGGVSVSTDGGSTWRGMNDQLGNTAIDAMAVGPGEPDQLYAATSTKFYRTKAGETTWSPFGEGLPPFPEEVKFKSLLLLPGRPGTLWFGSSQGLFFRQLDAPRWSEEPHFHQTRVSALAHETANGRLWVGTLGKGLFARDKNSRQWRSIPIPPGLWINAIVTDPVDADTIYLATRGEGLYKSTNGGKQWAPLNAGLDERDIRSLAVHPLNRLLLVAGTTNKGLFRSTDGGKQWAPAAPLPPLTMDQIIARLMEGPAEETPAAGTLPAAPPAFAKCNRCHGWTDPLLNQKHTYWRVTPNDRDWIPTVGRMAQRAGLTPAEQSAIAEYLAAYSLPTRTAMASVDDDVGRRLLRDRCGTCHGISLDAQCVAGRCESGRVHAITARPWNLVVPWMRAMGCAITDAEQATLTEYLMRHHGRRYAVEWEPAGSVSGGWNVVALAPFQGRLFAGIEGNGSVVRLADGPSWIPVLTTPNYTFYGLVTFHDQLYAATNDPAAEIWSSSDGDRWGLRSRLAGEKGITSLGLFQGALYAGTARAAIYRSTDGANWSPAGRLLPDAVSSFTNWIRFLLPFDGTLYAGIESSGLYRSDDGVTWRPDWPADAHQGVRGAALFRGELYVGTTAGGEIWRRREGAKSAWELVFSTREANQRGYVASMAVLGDFLYAGVGGLVFRTNDGRRWEEVGHLGPYTIEAMAPFGRQLYAGTALPPNTRLYAMTESESKAPDDDE